MNETIFQVSEGGDVRLVNQPRGYHFEVIEDGNRRQLFCYSVLKQEDKFRVYHMIGRGMPYMCAESSEIREALRIAFENVNKNAITVSIGNKLQYKLLKDSEFLPENLKNVDLI